MVKTQPLRQRSNSEFLRHVAGFLLLGVVSLTLALGIGTVGYHLTAGLPWIDSLQNASMILSGMGPVSIMPDDLSKLFSSAYAIFAGAAYPAISAVVLYPFVHRMLVALHLEASAAEAETNTQTSR